MSFDTNALLGEATQHAEDQTVVKTGGGDFPVPAAGQGPIRFVGYIETGRHAGEWQGKAKEQDKVTLLFELSGSKENWAPRKLDDGRIIPQIIRIKITKSQAEKAGFVKLFRTMNEALGGGYKNMPSMLGKVFLGTIFHNKDKEGKTYANLDNKTTKAWGIANPVFEHPVNGEKYDMAELAGPQVSPMRYYSFDGATKLQWDSIFIDGVGKPQTDDAGNETTPGKSLNVYQLEIMTALNFPGSPAEEFAKGVDQVPFDVDEPERSEDNVQASADANAKPTTVAAADPLAGI